MRVSWDEKKNELLKADARRGNIGFEEVSTLFTLPYYEAQRNDNPLQFLAIGWVQGKLYSLVFEMREDDEGEFYHFVTFWPATKYERTLYEKES